MKTYIPNKKIPRRVDTIYTKHKYYQCLKGDITYFYNQYNRKRHWFKKDEWIFVKRWEEPEFKHHKFMTDQVLLPGAFNYHNLIIEGEEYSDIGWD